MGNASPNKPANSHHGTTLAQKVQTGMKDERDRGLRGVPSGGRPNLSDLGGTSEEIAICLSSAKAGEVILTARQHDSPPTIRHGPAPAFAGACVDGPLDARQKSRSPTIGSFAIMCPACWRGSMAAGPDGIRDPAPNKLAASKAVAPDGFSRSSVRPMVISFSSHTLASTRGSGGGRLLPACSCHASSWPMPYGPSGWLAPAYAGVQSRPKPRGGSIARSSDRSSSTIARKASAVALSCRFSGRASSQAA